MLLAPRPGPTASTVFGFCVTGRMFVMCVSVFRGIGIAVAEGWSVSMGMIRFLSVAILTRPAPARSAAVAVNAGAPIIVGDPPRMMTVPKVPLCEFEGLGGSGGSFLMSLVIFY